jgi:hypothetical protein
MSRERITAAIQVQATPQAVVVADLVMAGIVEQLRPDPNLRAEQLLREVGFLLR